MWTLRRIEHYAPLIMQPHYRVKHWPWKSQFSQEDFCLPVKFAKWNSRRRPFLLMKTTFSWTLLLNLKMIVFGLLARKRCGQKSPSSRKGEICQPRHALCWCVLWRIRKTAFHYSQGKRKWQTLRESLLPKLVEDCKYRLSCGFMFQQDRTAAHTAKLAQTWIAANCSDFVGKVEWPPNSPDLKPLDYHVWGAMRERYKTFQRKPNTIDQLKKVLQSTWDDLPQNSINKVILNIVKKLRACVKAGAGHFEHVLRSTVFTEFWTGSKRCFFSDFNTSIMMKIVIFIVNVLHGSVVA